MSSKKTFTLVYGDDDQLLKNLANDIREKDKFAVVGLRSARLFTVNQVEDCDNVIVIGSHPLIEEAYGNKVDAVKFLEDGDTEPKASKPAKEPKAKKGAK